MPAKSKAQQRLFGMAYAVRKGEMERSEASEEVLKIVDGDMSTKKIKDYAETKHDNLPDKVEEGDMALNPGMNTPGMGPVSMGDNPGSNNAFHSQTPGSGDVDAKSSVDMYKQVRIDNQRAKEFDEIEKKKEMSFFNENFDHFLNESLNESRFYYIETWYKDGNDWHQQLGSDGTAVLRKMPKKSDIDNHIKSIRSLSINVKPYLSGKDWEFRVTDENDRILKTVKVSN